MMTFGLPSATLLFASLVALAITPGMIARAFSMGWLRWLGGISYGIYVFHILLVRGFNELAQRLAGSASNTRFLVLRLLIAAIASVGIATLSFHLYEKQFLRLKRYFLPRPQPSAGNGAPDALTSALPPN